MDNNPNKTDSVPPAAQKGKGFGTQFGMAMELPFVLFGAIAVGGLGFFAGLRDILRRLPG